MSDKKFIEEVVEWSTNVYTGAFSPLINVGKIPVVTDLSDFGEEFRELDRGMKIIENIKKEPNRPKNFRLSKNNSIVYIPNLKSYESVFEETWHSVSPLNGETKEDETFVPVPIYIALREAIKEDKIDINRPKEIIENSIEGEYKNDSFNLTTVDEEKYQWRNACLGLLEYFEKGKNGKPVEMKKVVKISKQILEDIVNGEPADRAIAKWERKLKNQE